MNDQSLFNIVLVAPEIPGNTGSIGRTCVALNLHLHLHLIHPLGFDLSEKAVRRAGLDYWKYVRLSEYQSWQDFLEQRTPSTMIFYSRFSQENHFYKAPYQNDCYLIFGSETLGLPKDILETYQDSCYALPTFSEQIRSLNLSNVVTAASYEALRQIQYIK